MKDLDEQFQPYERLLKRRPQAGSPPAFQAAWLQQAPRVPLSELEIRKVLRQPRSWRPLVAGLAAAVLVSIVAGVWYTAARQPAQLARDRALVLAVRGSAQVVPAAAALGLVERGAAQADWELQAKPIARGAALGGGDWILTGQESAVDLGLPGGTVIRVSAGTRLSLEELGVEVQDGSRDELRLHQGRLLSVVERLKGGDQFNVRTPTAIAGVRGTSFRVSTDGQSTEVYVVNGMVEVKPATAPDQAVVVGQSELALVERADVAPQLGENQDEEFTDERELDELTRRLEGEASPDVQAVAVDEALRQARAERARSYERIILKNGEVIRGKVVSQTGSRLFVETEERSFVIDRSQVASIEMN